MKLKPFLLLLFFFGNIAAQNDAKILSASERNAVNKYIVFANHCNHYLNSVGNVLNQYNNKLNKTYETIAKNPTSETFAIQKEKFNNHITPIVFAIEKEYQKAKSYKKYLPRKRFLLLDQELDKLYSQTKKLKTNYSVLQKQSKETLFKHPSFSKTYAILRQLTIICGDFVDLNYSFSIASVIFYGKQTELTPLLQFLNKKAAQTKDIIMGVRQKNKKNVRLFFNNFNALKNYEISNKDVVQLNAKGVQISFSQLQENYYSLFLKSYAKITQVASNYLNKGKNNLIYLRTLSKLIKEFDYQANKSGIAHLYNDLVGKTKTLNYKLFVEEPLPYGYWLPRNYTKSLQISLPKPKEVTQKKTTSTPIETIANGTENSDQKPITKKTFIKNDTKTLYGAKYNNLVFLLDVSRSMHQDDKLPLLKSSIVDLVNIMRPEDKIAIIIYSGESKVILETATIANKDVILKAIDNLSSAGSTNVTAGLRLAYSSVLKSFSGNSNNKIILATDGDFKITTYLNKLITKNTQNNIDLSIFHYGKDTHIDNLTNLEKIAALGNGNFKHIETKADATKALIFEAKKEK